MGVPCAPPFRWVLRSDQVERFEQQMTLGPAPSEARSDGFGQPRRRLCFEALSHGAVAALDGLNVLRFRRMHGKLGEPLQDIADDIVRDGGMRHESGSPGAQSSKIKRTLKNIEEHFECSSKCAHHGTSRSVAEPFGAIKLTDFG